MSVPRGKRPILIGTVGSDFRVVGVLPPVVVGVAYSQNVLVIGGKPTMILTQAGILPDGITFTDNGDGTGTFAGTGTSVGTYPITVSCIDATRRKRTTAFTLLSVIYAAVGGLVTEDTSSAIITEDTSSNIIQEDT